MLRLLSIATLVLVVACLIISASIALADAPTASSAGRAGVDELTAIDIYEFDFAIEPETLPNPEFDEFITSREI